MTGEEQLHITGGRKRSGPITPALPESPVGKYSIGYQAEKASTDRGFSEMDISPLGGGQEIENSSFKYVDTITAFC